MQKHEAAAQNVWAAVRAGMHRAALVQLGPGESWQVAASFVLLQGSLSHGLGGSAGGKTEDLGESEGGLRGLQDVASPCAVVWAASGPFEGGAVAVQAGAFLC